MAHKLAVECPRITSDVIEITEFPELIKKYKVSGVPKIVLNETVELVGAQPLPVFLGSIRQLAA